MRLEGTGLYRAEGQVLRGGDPPILGQRMACPGDQSVGEDGQRS